MRKKGEGKGWKEEEERKGEKKMDGRDGMGMKLEVRTYIIPCKLASSSHSTAKRGHPRARRIHVRRTYKGEMSAKSGEEEREGDVPVDIRRFTQSELCVAQLLKFSSVEVVTRGYVRASRSARWKTRAAPKRAREGTRGVG
jgi:hypothetical protein